MILKKENIFNIKNINCLMKMKLFDKCCFLQPGNETLALKVIGKASHSVNYKLLCPICHIFKLKILNKKESEESKYSSMKYLTKHH